MRELRAELSLGASGVARGAAQARSILAGLQSHFRSTGRSLATLIDTTAIDRSARTAGSMMAKLLSVQAAQGRTLKTEGLDSVRAGVALAKELQSRLGNISNITAQWKEYQKLRTQLSEVLKATRALANAEAELTKAGKTRAQMPSAGFLALALAHQNRANQPAQLGMLSQLFANLRTRYQANAGQGGMQHALGTVGMMMGGGRMGGLGGAVGGMFGMAGWGAAIGAGIGMVLAGFKRLFDFIRNGLMNLFNFARSLQNQKLQTGIGYQAGTVLSRMAEMGEIDMAAAGLWISRFQANLGVVAKTAPTVSNALFMLGLPLMELRKMKPAEAFDAVLDRLAGLKNWADQAAVSVALFNRQGAEMLRLLFHRRIAREQVGVQAGMLDQTVWTDALGQAVKLGDVLAFVGNAIGSVAVKIRGFFVGLSSVMGSTFAVWSDKFNQLDLAPIGAKIGSVLKYLTAGFEMLWPMLKTVGYTVVGLIVILGLWLTPIALVGKGIEYLIGKLMRLAEWLHLAGDTSISRPALHGKALTDEELLQWKSKIPVTPEKGISTLIAPLSSFWAPFGKGPGDAWSKMGAFTAPGMKEQFATGIKGWQDKVVDKLTQIAANTKGWGGKAWQAIAPTSSNPKDIMASQRLLPPAYQPLTGAFNNQVARVTMPSGSLPKDLGKELSRPKPEYRNLNILPTSQTNWLQKIHSELKGRREPEVNVNMPGSAYQFSY